MYTIVYDDVFPEPAKQIRRRVFQQEQGFLNEFDDIDNNAFHIVIFDGNLPAATCRLFRENGNGRFIIGRVAVIKELRGNGIGREIIKEAEKLVMSNGGESLSLHSQVRAKEFYKKLGYMEYGKIEDDEGCPHIWMTKNL